MSLFCFNQKNTVRLFLQKDLTQGQENISSCNEIYSTQLKILHY
jgi:hypothetical protein